MRDSLPPAVFIADSKGLDFLNSVATPDTTPFEWVRDGEGLMAWLRQADVVPHDVLDAFAKNALPGELDAVANQARALREWFRGFVIRHMGKTLGPKALDELGPLNRVLARDEEFGQIVAGRSTDMSDAPTPLVWEQRRRWRSPEALLIPIAQSMADLVTTEDFAQVKACQGHECSMLFADHTRSRARRWCNMALCGNRAKQAAHRDRRAAGTKSVTKHI